MAMLVLTLAALLMNPLTLAWVHDLIALHLWPLAAVLSVLAVEKLFPAWMPGLTIALAANRRLLAAGLAALYVERQGQVLLGPRLYAECAPLCMPRAVAPAVMIVMSLMSVTVSKHFVFGPCSCEVLSLRVDVAPAALCTADPELFVVESDVSAVHLAKMALMKTL